MRLLIFRLMQSFVTGVVFPLHAVAIKQVEEIGRGIFPDQSFYQNSGFHTVMLALGVRVVAYDPYRFT